MEALQNFRSSYEEFPVFREGDKKLSSTAPPPILRDILRDTSTADEDLLVHRVLKEGVCMRALVPLTSLKFHPDLGPFRSADSARIKESFGLDPTQDMLSHPAIGIPLNPQCFPRPSNKNTFSFLSDKKCMVVIVDGQHRVRALLDFCYQHRIPAHLAFWPFNILHPEITRRPTVITKIASRTSGSIDRLLVEELHEAVDAAATFYSTHPPNDRALEASLRTLTKTEADIETAGGDVTLDQVIRRITSCRHIVDATTKSNIILSEQWRLFRSGLSIVQFLYTLQCSDLGPISSNLIHGAAELHRLVEEHLNRPLARHDFIAGVLVNLDENDFKHLQEKVSTKFHIPCMPLLPNVFDTNHPPRVLTDYLSHCRKVLRVVVALAIGMDQAHQVWARKRSIQHPQDQTQCALHMLKTRVHKMHPSVDLELWDRAIIHHFAPDNLELLLGQWRKNVLDKVKNINEALAFKHATLQDCKAFANRTLELLKADERWYALLTSTRILSPGDLITLPNVEPFPMPQMTLELREGALVDDLGYATESWRQHEEVLLGAEGAHVMVEEYSWGARPMENAAWHQGFLPNEEVSGGVVDDDLFQDFNTSMRDPLLSLVSDHYTVTPFLGFEPDLTTMAQGVPQLGISSGLQPSEPYTSAQFQPSEKFLTVPPTTTQTIPSSDWSPQGIPDITASFPQFMPTTLHEEPQIIAGTASGHIPIEPDTILGLPVDATHNLLNAFRRLSRSAQQRFNETEHLETFTSWANVSDRKRAPSEGHEEQQHTKRSRYVTGEWDDSGDDGPAESESEEDEEQDEADQD